MLSIELTTNSAGSATSNGAILTVAAYFVFKATRPEFDLAVNCHVFPRHYGQVNPNGPISSKNPLDTKREELITQFECADGKISIIEYVNDASKAPSIVFAPDKHDPNRVFLYYYEPLTRVDTIKDPLRHALAYAVYNMVYGGNWG